ncbi:AAA family ATPase [Pedobacter sp. MC2016-15]|uniref:AAA family ATPase n=1 Tax=Pedobacter sp. MC2016-15 TaxID=2994473 RepID=UPI00224550F4|nr:AAA family ATPase [Pedobacter sp. MC2016-15]MCX2481050.1 AAA family ATPase [Pedobacter sp. MC2016-15]
MQINSLDLHNIGPFKNESICFIKDDNDRNYPPVTIITGDNGSGKSIILDSIRALITGGYSSGMIERAIVSDPKDFKASMNVTLEDLQQITIESTKLNENGKLFELTSQDFGLARHVSYGITLKPTWFIDYWTSKLSTDSFEQKNIRPIDPKLLFAGALSGKHSNLEVSESITFFDYLKGSDDSEEQKMGTEIYDAIKTIIKMSVANGNFHNVSRSTLQPIIKVNGKLLTLDKLSSGNVYILQRLISLLTKAYSVMELNKDSNLFKSVFDVPGILLIDEAENHLHPKWQKVLLKNILEVFPKLQIIVTTHSPFIISSVTNANIYVCKVHENESSIVDETDLYSNMPIDEILTTELFNTLPFSDIISQLIEARNNAIKSGNKQEEKRLENQLLEINPQYFSYLLFDDKLKELFNNKR